MIRAALAAALLTLVAAPVATAQTTHDLRGTWRLTVTVGTAFPHVMTITSMNQTTGAFSGTGRNEDGSYTWTITGTATGDTVHATAPYNEIPYQATFDGNIAPDSSSMAGTFTDSSGQSGTWSAFNVRGRQPVGGEPGGEPPPPEVGKNFNAGVVSGEVSFKCPGGREQPLEDGTQLKVGCRIDARDGKVRITSAAGGGKTQSAVFNGGQFKVVQKKGRKPVTELRLVGALEGCSAARASSREEAAASRRRRGRRLWGSGKGRFRTRGRRSAATVTGTRWLVEDRCDGSTLTRVARGVVKVRDFGRRRTVTVRAGGRYVARP
jgi:hypothetical protein